jgi:hypothetical protein
MEELLNGIVKDANGPKLQNLKQSAQFALGNLHFKNLTFNFNYAFGLPRQAISTAWKN